MDWDERERARLAAEARPAADPGDAPAEGEHRHVLVLHRHPDWHGHCDPHRRGFKRCRRLHWHFWYHHGHALPATGG